MDLKELIIQIQIDQAKRNEYKVDEPLPISYFYQKSKDQTLIDNNDSFVHFQLLIDCLSRMKQNSNDRKTFIQLCKDQYENNDIGLKMIADFEKSYTPDRAIWWLTRESFVCRILNKSFQVLNIDLLYYFNFFISDTRQQLESIRCQSPIRTYRAQIMSSKELKLLKRAIGQIISIDTFLFTIPNRQRALQVLQESDIVVDLKRVIFEIHANPSLGNSKPFGNIASLNYFTDVEVVLFMAGTIFHPVDVCEENDITIIQMETHSDDEPSIKEILDDIKGEDYNCRPNLLSFGYVLSKMKQFYYAEKYYNQLLKEMPNDHRAVVGCYQGFGQIALEKQEYDTSLKWFKKALDTDKAILKSKDPAIAAGYNTIADVYVKQGKYTEAIESYTKALEVWISAFGNEHLKVAKCYINMARTFEKQEQFSEAVAYYKKALIVYEKNLNSDPMEVANLYNHIGNLFAANDEDSQALKYYAAALKILTKCCPYGHPEVIKTKNSIAATFEITGNLNQALAHYEQIHSIYRELLPLNHPDRLEIVENIQRVFARLK